ncbi:NAD(P)-bd dom domain-containing protein [Citrus sinensis]|uniref:sanguinarine reductase isoform X1 n=1 Tax=Citrus sinensis TaxID=2711 RepID=UPI002192CC9D|nr:sanguinarine reductase isoform X1 [Citrus sinensis]KAH9741577.1 NAD(P)-bd dom domain-containing protein [Citrus sinensis]
MATELFFFTSIPNLPFPLIKFPKHHQSLPLFSLAPPTISSRFKTVSSSKARPSSSTVVVHAVQEEVVQTPNSDSKVTPASSSKLVLVAGGSGGVGQLVVASLLSRNIKSRLLLRDPEKATTLFGKQDEETLLVCKGDTRNPKDLDPAIFEGVTHVICCTGTTAFPSRRWDGDNTPEKVDWEGVRNLVSALPSSLKRIVLVSSVGVTKFNELPWSIMNLFGVLKYKKMGEDFVQKSGLPFTIIRAGRLTDGPYTSYDLNTLLKATAGERCAVLMGQGDKLIGEVSRIVVAEACIQALDIEFTEGEIYEINSVEGEGPGSDPQKWRELFKAAKAK